MWVDMVRATTAIVLATQLVACSSPGSPSTPLGQSAISTSATQRSTASPHANPDSFSGPIVMHCLALSKSTTISKLNLGTGELATIAIFPNYCAGSAQWNTNYSPDFRKVVNWMPRSDHHVGYYDSRTGTSVDVTNIVSPTPTGDFGVQTIPQHVYPQFDDQGLFAFFDVRAAEYKFFDTNSKQIVRTSKAYYPKYLPQLALNPVVVKPTEMPEDQNSRLCDAKWIIDANRYLRTVNDNQGNYQLVVEPIPKSADRPNCLEVAGQRVTPPGMEISQAAADPTGSTIIFLMYSRTNMPAKNLYRVNTEDPDHPTQIKLADDLLDTAGVNERGKGQVVSFVGWR
ncbi:hypothetical protein [Mycobacteroides abscessus]|uniref:hypothetical protein n=1 Tax=Mycobacteroides abscessus TaxID=36809 RepID=UPI00232B2327|nr:hypothetical protein [Mycobacteroides abscessus]MDB2210886.1 hypothetical protein [Mycobacteroides abscessus subsp. massiliense]MDB2233977.1 hypothetical protein [Mycobacteroides abscessus subsp. massiliense]